MSGFTFTKATREQARLRLALIGVSGSGKTYTALTVAQHLGARVAVIDTERGSASKYAGLFSFDVLELETFAPQTYVQAIQAADAAGYDVLVIDSLSHAWMGKGGALEMKDTETARSRNHDSYGAWRTVTPEHNRMVDAILSCRAHVIVTMRAKTEYVQEKGPDGKTVIRKVGLAPVQRDGLEYEFDVVGDMDADNNLIVSKTRCPALAGAVLPKPGQDLADRLRAWLGQGEAPTHTPAVTPPAVFVDVPLAAVSTPPTATVTATPTNGAAPRPVGMSNQQFLDRCADELGLTLTDIRQLFPMTVNEFMKEQGKTLEEVFDLVERRTLQGDLLPHEQPASEPSDGGLNDDDRDRLAADLARAEAAATEG